MAKNATVKQTAPAKIGGNIEGLYEEIRADMDELNELDKKSKEINDQKQAIRSRLEAKGLIKKGQAAARTYFNLSPEDKKAFDNTYIMVRDAMGCGIKGAQLDLGLDAKPSNDAAAPADEKGGE